MIWIEDSVLYAIAEAVREDAMLLVFIDGEDDESLKLRTVFDVPVVAFMVSVVRCVAVRVAVGTTTYLTFTRHFTVNKAPTVYFMTPRGKVTATIEGYVTPDEFADRLAPLANWAAAEQRPRSPATAICEDIAERLSRPPRRQSSRSPFTVDNGKLTAERKSNNPVPTKNCVTARIFAGDDKGPFVYACEQVLDENQPAYRWTNLVCGTPCGDERIRDAKDFRDGSVHDEILCGQAASPKFAFFNQKFTEKVSAHTDNANFMTFGDSSGASMPRATGMNVMSRAPQLLANTKSVPATTTLNHPFTPAQQERNHGSTTPLNTAKDDALHFSRMIPIRHKVGSEPKRDLGSAQLSGPGTIAKSASADGAHGQRHEWGDPLPHEWTCTKSQDSWPPKDVLIDDQPVRARRSTGSGKRERAPAFDHTPCSRVDQLPYGPFPQGGPRHGNDGDITFESLQKSQDETSLPSQTSAKNARIFFLLPDGTYISRSFASTRCLGDVRWVLEDLLCPKYRKYFPFTLVRTNGCGEFTAEDYRKTIGDLNLGPSPTLLVRTRRPSSDNATAANDVTAVPSSWWLSLLSTMYEVLVKAPAVHLWITIVASSGTGAAVPHLQ